MGEAWFMAWYGLSFFSWRCRNITTNFWLTIGLRVLIYTASGSAFCIHFLLTEEQLSSWGYGDPCHLLTALPSCLFCCQLHPIEGYFSGEHCMGIRSTFCWDSKNLTLSRTAATTLASSWALCLPAARWSGLSFHHNTWTVLSNPYSVWKTPISLVYPVLMWALIAAWNASPHNAGPPGFIWKVTHSYTPRRKGKHYHKEGNKN